MLSQYEEMKKIFQLNCRMYWMERKEMEDMKARYPGIDVNAKSLRKIKDDRSTMTPAKRYWYLMQAVEWVDSVFNIILSEYGDFAYRMLWNRFIETRTQDDVANEMGLTRRQLQYEEDKIIRGLMERINERQKLNCI